MIDPRPDLEFRQIRIPASVNLPVRVLQRKAYLKERRLLLVDHAYRWAETKEACASLRATGFSHVRALSGGLEAWADRIGPLAGDRLAESTLHRLSPYELDRGASHGGWLVIDVSDESSAGDFSTEVVHVPINQDEDQFAAALRAAVEANDSGDDDRIMVITDGNGAGYTAIERILGRDRSSRLYFLEGGVEAYRAHRGRQVAILERATQPLCQECGR